MKKFIVSTVIILGALGLSLGLSSGEASGKLKGPVSEGCCPAVFPDGN